MYISNQPATIFRSEEHAATACAGLDANEYRILVDPKGSGRCLIELLDEETGEAIGKL